MKKAIWKFVIETTDEQTVNMPKGAKILSVQTQHEAPCIWALVDPLAEKEPRKILVFGTGHPIKVKR